MTIKHGANISIYGVGNTGELENVGFNIRDYQNVIVKNMKIHEVFYPDDDITIDACQHVWVDHNELYSKIGTGITVDTYDGLLDIKNGSCYVTVSWNHLHHHMKCSLIGHTDDIGQQTLDSQMRITYHHNWFSYTDGRNPSIRFGAIHMFNNYFEEITDYGIAARDGAHAKIENCHYNNVVLPMSTDKFPVTGLPNGYICESGNIFAGTCGANVISQTGCDFWDSATLPYSYTLDPVETVEGTVKLLAGVGVTTSVVESTPDIPRSIGLQQNYPNPFNPTTTIQFSVGKRNMTTLKVFNLLGQQVATLFHQVAEPGQRYQIIFNASTLPSGIYFSVLENGGTRESKRMLLLK
jgi:pectate lyase